MRWWWVPDKVRLAAGGAWLAKRRFLETAARSSSSTIFSRSKTAPGVSAAVLCRFFAYLTQCGPATMPAYMHESSELAPSRLAP